jgi:hypothetical protein
MENSRQVDDLRVKATFKKKKKTTPKKKKKQQQQQNPSI